MLSSRAGSSMVEVVIALGLLVILTIGISSALMAASHSQAAVLRKSIAKDIAVETIEEYMANNPVDISAMATVEPTVRAGLGFNINKTITFEGATPRVSIVVTSTDASLTKQQSFQLSSLIPLRGSR